MIITGAQKATVP